MRHSGVSSRRDHEQQLGGGFRAQAGQTDRTWGDAKGMSVASCVHCCLESRRWTGCLAWVSTCPRSPPWPHLLSHSDPREERRQQAGGRCPCPSTLSSRGDEGPPCSTRCCAQARLGCCLGVSLADHPPKESPVAQRVGRHSGKAELLTAE